MKRKMLFILILAVAASTLTLTASAASDTYEPLTGITAPNKFYGVYIPPDNVLRADTIRIPIISTEWDQDMFGALEFYNVTLGNSEKINEATLSLWFELDVLPTVETLTITVYGADTVFSQGATLEGITRGHPTTDAYTTIDLANISSPQWVNITVTSIVQEIVNKYGWSSGKSLAVVIYGVDAFTARSFQSNVGVKYPKLYVTHGENDPEQGDELIEQYRGFDIYNTTAAGEVPLAYMGFNTSDNTFLFNNLEQGSMDIPIILGDQYTNALQTDYIKSGQPLTIRDDTAYNGGTWYVCLSNSTTGVNLWKTEDNGQNWTFIDSMGGSGIDAFDIEIVEDYILIGYLDSGTTNYVNLRRYYLVNETLKDSRHVFEVNDPLFDKYGFDMDSYTNETGSYVFMSTVTDVGSYRHAEGIMFYPDWTNSSYFEVAGAVADMVLPMVDISQDGKIAWCIYRGSGVWFVDFATVNNWQTTFETSLSSFIVVCSDVDQFFSHGFESGNNPTWYFAGRDETNDEEINLKSSDDYSSIDSWSWLEPQARALDDIRLVMMDGYSSPYLWVRDNQQVWLMPFNFWKTNYNVTYLDSFMMMEQLQSNIRNMFDHEDLGSSGGGGLKVVLNGTTVNTTCIQAAIAANDLDAIKACLDGILDGSAPDDPNPAGSDWGLSYWFSRAKLKLYFFIGGLIFTFVPLYAYIGMSGYDKIQYIWIILFCWAIAFGLFISIMGF